MNHLSWALNDKWIALGYQGRGTGLQVGKNHFFFLLHSLNKWAFSPTMCRLLLRFCVCIWCWRVTPGGHLRCGSLSREVRIHQGITDERGSVPCVWSKRSREPTVWKGTPVHAEDFRKTLLWEKNHQRAVWTRGKKRSIWQGKGGGSVSSEMMVRGWLLSFACGFGAVT